MRKLFACLLRAQIGLAALTIATAGQAAAPVQITFPTNATNPVAVAGTGGPLASSSQTFANGSYSVTAKGYSNFIFAGTGSNTGTAGNLYDKSSGSNEVGIGLASDPSGNGEIWYAGPNQTPTIVLDVSGIHLTTTAGQFMMGSSTSNEQWMVYGYDGSNWTKLLTSIVPTPNPNTTQLTWIDLPNWATDSKYAFISGGTVSTNSQGVVTRAPGNVLLSALRFTPSVPEPSTWAMMLLGFGAMGLSMRHRRASLPAQLA